jgi:hypothetical protein
MGSFEDSWSLVNDSNFDAYDREPSRYPRILEATLAQKGISLDDVLAASKTMQMVVICRSGIFVASESVGLFRQKRVDVWRQGTSCPSTESRRFVLNKPDVSPFGSTSSAVIRV